MTEPIHPRDRGTRQIEVAVEVPGTPEEVWDTIATGPGISSWFVPHEVQEHEGGRVAMDFGSFGTDEAQVSAWEPPWRIELSGHGERALAFEWLVEAQDGGTCIVRLVNSGFGDGDDWDGQYDGMTEGWQVFLQNLRLQLTYFRGQRCRAVTPTVVLPGPNDAAWKALCDVLGVPDNLDPGARLQTSGAAPELSGRVEIARSSRVARTYLLVVDEQAPGTALITAEGDGDQVAASVYSYLYGNDSGTGEALAAYLGQRFPAMTDELGAEAFADPANPDG